MSRVRRIALPFRYVNGKIATVEQDSDTDVEHCVMAVLAYTIGHRRGSPDFGIPPQEHRQGGADMEEVADAVARWEERAEPMARDSGESLASYSHRVLMSLEQPGG